jgi:hypothetical protein
MVQRQTEKEYQVSLVGKSYSSFVLNSFLIVFSILSSREFVMYKFILWLTFRVG